MPIVEQPDDEWDGDTVDDSAANMVSLNPGVVYLMDNGMDVGLDIHYVSTFAEVLAPYAVPAHVGDFISLRG